MPEHHQSRQPAQPAGLNPGQGQAGIVIGFESRIVLFRFHDLFPCYLFPCYL